jgi:hypothetical protein
MVAMAGLVLQVQFLVLLPLTQVAGVVARVITVLEVQVV